MSYYGVKKNSSGYNDPTAYAAITKVDYELYRLDKAKKLIETILNMCSLSGFKLEEKIVLRDKKTGRIFRWLCYGFI